jgi:type II secretory pathway pseudopilin PulG
MKHSNLPRRSARRDDGISLIVVLVALLIIGFAAVALLRSSDTGTLVTGNLAFKKAALAAGDVGTEAALTWLGDNAGDDTLFDDVAASGYFATTADICDLTGSRTPGDISDDVNWDGVDPGENCNLDAFTMVGPPGVPDGYTVSYVINRVCNAPGDSNAIFAKDGVTPMVCSTIGAGVSEGSTRGGGSYGNTPLTGESQTYYRITTRIDGPRNTVRYIQASVVL